MSSWPAHWGSPPLHDQGNPGPGMMRAAGSSGVHCSRLARGTARSQVGHGGPDRLRRAVGQLHHRRVPRAANKSAGGGACPRGPRASSSCQAKSRLRPSCRRHRYRDTDSAVSGSPGRAPAAARIPGQVRRPRPRSARSRQLRGDDRAASRRGPEAGGTKGIRLLLGPVGRAGRHTGAGPKDRPETARARDIRPSDAVLRSACDQWSRARGRAGPCFGGMVRRRRSGGRSFEPGAHNPRHRDAPRQTPSRNGGPPAKGRPAFGASRVFGAASVRPSRR